jgi:hypothetical protein
LLRARVMSDSEKTGSFWSTGPAAAQQRLFTIKPEPNDL